VGRDTYPALALVLAVVDPSGSLDPVQLEIHGHHLPGRSWHLDGAACDNVHVGVQVGRETCDLTPGDAETAVWTISLELIEGDGDVDFRGPAVQGRRGERFVYLTWGNVDEEGMFTMLRRAKLMLADIEPLLHSGSTSDRRIIATIDLTDDCGGPRCARLRSPALVLTSATG
jgi:Family of unknown function (DUF5990)